MLLEHIQYFAGIVFIAVAALLPIIDPFAGAPIYLAMTSGLTSTERARMAKLVALNSFVLLLASILVGAYVLDFFGVSIPAVQIAGGLVVCALAWSLLNGPISPEVSASASPPNPDSFAQRAFYPLTMPLTVGPGSISVAITLGANPPRGLRDLLTTTLAHVVGVLITALAIYLCYRYADRLVRRLGTTGTNIMIRLTAFILLAIGTQIIWNGVRTLLDGVLHPSAGSPASASVLSGESPFECSATVACRLRGLS
ncbi:MAG TPA: MarC family protein [Steroidobacteraceae bacterium]|nr:MarC family protein [Steroidobacteraceae bacterium]